jgi:hypothetical protein
MVQKILFPIQIAMLEWSIPEFETNPIMFEYFINFNKNPEKLEVETSLKPPNLE